MKIAFIGAGTMGEAMIKGLLAKGTAKPAEIAACDVKQARLDEVVARYGVTPYASMHEAVTGAQLIVISVKPQDLRDVVNDLKTHLPPEAVILSIAAGVPMSTLRQGFDHRYIVRSMPNMPAQIGEGITVWTATPEVTKEQKELVGKVLGSLGKEIYVANEDYVDMATAVSGSGPAFVFLVIEALIDAGVHVGLPRAISEKLALETIVGSAHAVQRTGKHPAELRNMVTSPGGTTTEGLKRLEAGGLRHLFLEAVLAAYEKAKALGKK